MGHDEAQLQQSRAALLLSEQRFRSVFNQQFQFMVILSPQGHVLEISEQLLLHDNVVPVEQLIERLFWETVWWAHVPEMRAVWPERLRQAALATGTLLSEDAFNSSTGEMRVASARTGPARSTQDAGHRHAGRWHRARLQQHHRRDSGQPGAGAARHRPRARGPCALAASAQGQWPGAGRATWCSRSSPSAVTSPTSWSPSPCGRSSKKPGPCRARRCGPAGDDAAPNGHAHLWVRDHGCGMDAATLARIFELLHDPAGRRGHGAGLVSGHAASARGSARRGPACAVRG